MSAQVEAGTKQGGSEVSSDVIQYEVDDHVATVWLNRPGVRNCVNLQLLTPLAAAVERADRGDDVRVVLFRGRGGVTAFLEKRDPVWQGR